MVKIYKKTLLVGAVSAATSIALPMSAIARAPRADAAAATAAEVTDLVKDHIAAFNARNAIAATSIDTRDYVGIFHGIPNTIGHAADLALTKEQVADPAMTLVIGNEHLDVAKRGDMATFRCTYRYTFTDAATKQPGVELGNYVIGFMRQPDGKMKAAWSVVSDTPAVP